MSTNGINLGRHFAGSNNAVETEAGDRPTANAWLNIGYMVEVPSTVEGAKKGDMEQRFVSLPVGIPVDTTEPLAINSRNADFNSFQAARNDLLEQIQEVAAGLQPGEEKIIGGTDGGLCIQVRRVSDPVATPAVDGTNKFAKKLSLVA